ncbi:MAG TPA: hypothetical protein VF480_08090, partial [Verrucomicrobiae bacterium]
EYPGQIRVRYRRAGVRTKARFSANTARSAISIANMPSTDWRPIRSDLRRRPGRQGLVGAKPGTLLKHHNPARLTKNRAVSKQHRRGRRTRSAGDCANKFDCGGNLLARRAILS